MEEIHESNGTLTGKDSADFQVQTTLPFTVSNYSVGNIRVGCVAKAARNYACFLTVTYRDSGGIKQRVVQIKASIFEEASSLSVMPKFSMNGTACTRAFDSVVIKNLGCEVLQVLGCTIGGKDSAQFTLPRGSQLFLQSGGIGHVALGCTADTLGVFTCTLDVQYMTADSVIHDQIVQVTATINGLTPTIISSADFINFGTVEACQSKDTTLSFRNIGCDTLQIDSLEGVLPSGVSFTGITFPLLLAPDSSVIVDIHFAPTSTSSIYQDIIYHLSEQGKTAEYPIVFQATDIKGSSILDVPDSVINFGNISTCSDLTLPAFYSSAGCDTVFVTGEHVSTNSGFTLLDDHLSTLPNGTEDSLHLKFVPPGAGLFVDTLTISSSVGTKQILLLAQGVPDSGKISLTTTSINYLPVTASCDSSTASFTFRNTTCDTVRVDSVSSPQTPFGTMNGGSLSGLIVQHDSSVTVNLGFVPSSAGAFADSVKIYYHTASGVALDTTIMLTATAIDAPSIGVMMKPLTLQAGTGAMIDVPIYLTGDFNLVASSSIGLQTLVMTLTMNTDLITPEITTSTIPAIGSVALQSVGDLTTLTVPLPVGFTFTNGTELLSLHCKSYLTDTMQTSITLQSANFTTSKVTGCFTQNSPSGASNFTFIPACGDSMISRKMRLGPAFVIQSIVPNPTKGIVNVILDKHTNEEIHYQLFDALGHAVLSGGFTSTANSLDMHTLSSGSYYLRVSTSSAVQSRRIVLQR